MWHGRQNYLSKEEYAAKFSGKNKSEKRVKEKDEKLASVSDDF